MRKALYALIATAGLAGCKAAPDSLAPPDRSQVQVSSDFGRYVKDTEELCEKKAGHLDESERSFYPFIDFLDELTKQHIGHQALDIVPDGIMAIIERQIGGISLLPNDGIYWFGDLLILDQEGKDHMGLEDITHEYAHAIDPNLSYLKYIFSADHRLRCEAVAESFTEYVGLRLKELGAPTGEHFKDKPEIAKTATLEDVFDDNRYRAARCLSYALVPRFGDIGKVWYFLARHDTDEVLAAYRRAIKGRTLYDAIEDGYARVLETREHPRAGAKLK